MSNEKGPIDVIRHELAEIDSRANDSCLMVIVYRVEEAMAALSKVEEEAARMREALRWYADKSNYNDIPLPIGTSQEFRFAPRHVVTDGGQRARAALKEATDV